MLDMYLMQYRNLSPIYVSADIIRNAERAGLLVYLSRDTQILLTAYFGHR